MKTRTLSKQIMDFLKKSKDWVGGNQLETSIYGYKGSSISRTARIMAEEGIIKRGEVYVKNISRYCVRYKV